MWQVQNTGADKTAGNLLKVATGALNIFNFRGPPVVGLKRIVPKMFDINTHLKPEPTQAIKTLQHRKGCASKFIFGSLKYSVPLFGK